MLNFPGPVAGQVDGTMFNMATSAIHAVMFCLLVNFVNTQTSAKSDAYIILTVT